MQRELTRRELLRRGGLVLVTAGVGPSLLAACGGGDGSTTAVEPTATAAQATDATTSAASDEEAAAPPASGKLDFLSWEGYDLPDQMAAWKQDNGVEVSSTYVGNHDEIQAKILASGESAGFDLITYYQGYAPLYGTELQILQPLDETKLPNVAGLFPFFGSDVRNLWINADGQRIGVPWTWTINALSYDEAHVEALPSYFDVLDSKFKGKVSVVNDAVGSTTIGAHILGYDVGAMTSDQYDQVKSEWLIPLLGQTQGIAQSFGDATSQLVSGDAWFAYPGWAALNSFALAAGKDSVRMTIPQEGGMSACDAWAIPVGADNTDTAYSWINETVSAPVNAAAADYLVAAVTVTDSVPLVTEETRSLFPYDDLDGLFEQAPLYNLPPVESDEYVTYQQMLDGWEEVKTAA